MDKEKVIILIHPDGEGKPKEFKMTIAKAEKMLKCRTTSKKWKLKDEKLSRKDGKITSK